MKITIKTISGKVYHLDDVEGDLTVDKLKLLTEKQTEIEPDCQRLIFKGKVLKNEQTLADAKLSNGDCIIVVKSRKKKKRSPEEKKEERNIPQAADNTNTGPPPAQANVQPNANQAFGFMMGQGQSPLPMNMNAINNLFQGLAQRNPLQPQSGAANGQQPSMAANNANAAPQVNPFTGLPFAAMMGQGANNQMPDLNSMMQLLQNPMIQEMLRSPATQQMLQQVMQNPQMMQNLMRNNPMMNGLLQNLGNNAFRPQAAAAAQSSAAAPNAVPVAQPAANNAAAVNADAASNAAPAANANAQQAVPNQQAANPQAAQPNPYAFFLGQLGQLGNQQPNAPLSNPLQAFMNAQQPDRQPVVLNDAQAREMYAAQLETLQNMGFSDEARNLRALRETAGSIEAAINMLLR